MSGQERRQKILNLMGQAEGPISGERLAKLLGVSRQVISLRPTGDISAPAWPKPAGCSM